MFMLIVILIAVFSLICGFLTLKAEKFFDIEESRLFYTVMVTFVGFLFAAFAILLQLNLEANLALNRNNVSNQLSMYTGTKLVFFEAVIYFGIIIASSAILRYVSIGKAKTIKDRNNRKPIWLLLSLLSWALLFTGVMFAFWYIYIFTK